MSIYKVNPGDVETFTVVTNPIRHYASSSLSGSFGSVNVFARRSTVEKEMAPLASFIDSTHDDADLSTQLRSLQQSGKYARIRNNSSKYVYSASVAFPGMLEAYMTSVNAQGKSARKHKALDVIRFTPTSDFTSNTIRKSIVKNVLSKYHRIAYPSAHWAYTNYNCLSFYTSSTVPTSSVLMYPSHDDGQPHDGYVSGTYMLSGAFSFDFYINPRYRPTQFDGDFRAGTIMHMSSTYAVSLVTGSSKDRNGWPIGYRLKLQLSHSADIQPSLAVPGAYPNDLTFLSDDNSLLWNNWHHVVIRWGTSLVNQGTGSFVVDGAERGRFIIPSSSIAPRDFGAGGLSSPDVLFIGNFFEGRNASTGSTSYFFAHDTALRDGLTELETDINFDEPNPLLYRFRHPLNADLHDVAIKRYYMSDLDIEQSSSVGPKSIDAWTAFYLPPFFVEEAPFRQFVGTYGGVPQTPFFEVDGTTDDPFNVAMSFGVAGHYINIENFLRDFASNVYPRVHHMTASIITTNSELRSANEFLYDQPFVRRRNTLLMPCDDGLYVPSFELLASESRRSNAVDDLGLEELSFINLDNLISASSALFGTDFGGDSSIVNESIGFTPENPGNAPGKAYAGYVDQVDKSIASGSYDPGVQSGAPLAVFQRTKDPSSNQVTFFDISNMYYGKRILPGSVKIQDASLSGSGGALKITLADDGRGNLYRSDCLTSASIWNSVGSVFYDEGIISIKSPHLYFFGKEGYDLSFRGDQNIHVMKFDVIAPANQLNSSSNPNFKVVPPSPYPNDPEKEFVYISGINLHDDNMNVVMKAQLAQPIMKRHGDKLLFRIKYDV